MLSPRLLIVEDDSNDVELLCHALADIISLNQIDRARNGQEALDYLLNTPVLPRLVLLDLNVPLLSGLDILERIRSHPRTSRLVVVVLTSSLEATDIDHCYNLSVNSYVVKPINFQEYIHIVKQIGNYWININVISL